MSVWFAFKDFKTKIFQVKMVITVTALLTANFTLIFFMLYKGLNNLQTFIPLLTLIVLALPVTLYHLTGKASSYIGILKALGAKKSTIVSVFFLELILVGIVGVLSGIFIGITFSLIFSFLINKSLMDGLILAENLIVLFVLCMLGVLVGALTGAFSTWKKSSKTVVESLVQSK